MRCVWEKEREGGEEEEVVGSSDRIGRVVGLVLVYVLKRDGKKRAGFFFLFFIIIIIIIIFTRREGEVAVV